jgi:hypothetical protein
MSNRIVLPLFLLAQFIPTSSAADAPIVQKLDVQRVGDITYFRVALGVPSDAVHPRYSVVDVSTYHSPSELREVLSRFPRLVSRDGNTRVIYRRHSAHPRWSPYPLEFLGQTNREGEVELVLLYLAEVKPATKWAELPLKLKLPAMKQSEPATRSRKDAPAANDLEGLWAEGQAQHFAALEAMSEEFGFYGLARESTGRKYNVPALPFPSLLQPARDRDEAMRLYELTTGATALAESLALRRMLNSTTNGGRRIHDVTSEPGIDIAEHPWKQMMEGKKPAAEPLAKLVPYDHYYVAFNSIRKFIEFGELSEQWGSPLTSAYEVSSRDFDLKGRYEKQLCIRQTALSKTLGPAIIRGLAVAGSDFYLREGSDVSVIFHVRQRDLFLAAVEPFLQEARTAFGKELRQEKTEYNKVTIESYVSPLREVSLHRASVGEFVIYSNSPVAIRRILDTQAGKRNAIADSLDFQYMRTIFRADDRSEDGFVFLPDAFIRRQVGPADRIKEKRRLEALASLYLLTHGALFSAWDTGKLPDDLLTLLSRASLNAEQIVLPEGKSVRWDSEHRLAVSDAYNTIQFLTPLIELPIERITDAERSEYRRFRTDYLNNWRQYFDPVGMRLGLKDSEVKFEVYILPLVKNSQYDSMRQSTGGGVAKLDLGHISPQTIAQYFMHLNPEMRSLTGEKNSLGRWVFFRWDDSPAYKDIVRSWRDYERNPPDAINQIRDQVYLLWQTPLTIGVEIGEEKAFDRDLVKFRDMANTYLGKSSKEDLKLHRGVSITRFSFDKDSGVADFLGRSPYAKGRPFVPILYHAKVKGGWYISTQESALKRTIDLVLDRKEPATTVEVNSALYFSPKAASQAAETLHGYLERETHKQALAAEPLWLSLYGSGVLSADATAKEAATTARKFLGFVPVSPDGAGYRFDKRTGEVVNARHGSMSQPRENSTLAADSPLARLLEQVPSLRADLRFREDGIHTIVTLKREKK